MRLELAPREAGLAPGGELDLHATIVNDGGEVLAPSVAVTGIAASCVSFPDGFEPIEPGTSAQLSIRIVLPADAAPGERRIGVRVSDPDGLHADCGAAVQVQVGAPPPVTVEVVPAVSRGRRATNVTTVLHSLADEPTALHLDGSGEGVEVAFLVDDPVIEPGEDLHVPTRIERTERSWFRERRSGTMIEVRGDGGPVTASAVVVQAPLIPPLLVKAVAFVTVLALWATAVFIGYDRLTREDVEFVKSYLLTEQAADALARATAGEDADVDPIDPDDVLLALGAPIVVQGSVAGPSDPVGTDVVIERIAFGDEGTTAGEGVRIAAMSPVTTPIGAVIERMDTTTDERGAFRFAGGLSAPAFYRVTAIRPGFEVASHVVTTSEEEREVTVDLELVPASGSLSGRVTDTDGNPLGGAEVTVTDGSLLYTATSATEGSGGTWSLSGIATPATYQVSVSHHGYATATLLVDIEGGQELTGVDAQLQKGLGTIRGRVTHRGEGVGAVTVQLSGNPTDRTTTTLTDGGLAGSFEFPAVSFGTYQLTFSAPGWLTQTSEVVVDRGDVEVLVTDLRPSTAVVQGRVHQWVAPGGGCRYPDPDEPAQRDQAELLPCGGVGVTVSDGDTLWRTTSATGDGSFQVSGLPAGEYLVSFEQFGYVPEFFEVTLDAGDVVTLPEAVGGERGSVVTMELVPLVDPAAGVIQGVLRDATSPTAVFDPPAGTTITVDDQPDVAAEQLTDGAFRITGVLPGAHTIRIEAPGYDVRTEVVRVPLGGTTDAGAIAITPLGSLALRVTGGQASVVGHAEVFVTPDPAYYTPESGRTLPNVEPAGAVVDCTRTIVLDGETQTLDGVCAETDAVGDLEFRRIFGTGAYVLATPANITDAADDPALRATTVALDHEQLVRRVDISSGQTVRLDLNLRRYPIITGTVLRPATGGGDGLEPAYEITSDDITFERIDANGNVLPLPDDAPTPRISAGGDPDSTLDAGRYRIDRIPADTGTETYLWRLVISSGGDTFERGPGQPGGPIDGLGFNETRTISALMLPAPQELRFELLWEPAGTDDPEPVPGGRIRLFGTSGFDVLDVAPFYVPINAQCPGPVCHVAPNEGDAPFDFRTTAEPRVVSFGGQMWLATGASGFDPAGVFTMPPFYRPAELDVVLQAVGFTSQSFEVDVESVEDGPFVIARTLEVLDRNVTGTVRLVPLGVTVPAALADLGLGEPAILDDLEVRLTDGDGFDETIELTTTGMFTFAGVTPGYYELAISGPRIEDMTNEVFVPPGSGAFVVSTAATDVTRTGVIRLDLVHPDGTDLDGVVPEGLDVELQRSVDGTTWAPVGDAVSDGDGRVTFDELPLYDPDAATPGALPWEYRLAVTHDEYRDALTGTFRLVDQPYVTAVLEVERFGELSGTVRGRIADGDPFPLPGATVTLVDRATLEPPTGLDVSVQAAGPEGAFSIGADERVPARSGEITQVCVPVPPDGTVCAENWVVGASYALLVRNEGYHDLVVPIEDDESFPFAYNSIVTDVDPILEALPGRIVGAVSGPDGYVLYDDGEGGVEVTVTLTKPSDPEFELVTTTQEAGTYLGVALPDGAFAFDEIDAGSYQLTFEHDEVTLLEHVSDVFDLDPDETHEEYVTLGLAPGQIEGEVVLLDFEGATTATPADGVTVTARLDGDVVATTTTDDGWFEFDDLLPGTYELEFVLSGYEGVEREAIVVAREVTVVVPDTELIAVPVDVEVTVTGTADTPLEDATVTATYDGPDAGTPAGDPFEVDTDEDGVSVLTIPPGDYTVSVSGTDVVGFEPRPHLAPDDEDLTVPLSTASPPTLSFSLAPFYGAHGRAVVRDEADDLVPAEGVTVSSSMDGSLFQPATTGADGLWTVWYPQRPPGSTPMVLTFSLSGYSQVTHAVPRSASNFGTLDSNRGDIELPPLPREVTVTVTSAAGADSLVGLELLAERDGLPDQTAIVDVDGGTVTATFDTDGGLAPGPWTLSTTNGGAAGRLALPDAVAHLDIAEVELDVPVGEDEYAPGAPVMVFAAVTGTVSGHVPDTEDDTVPLADTDVTVGQADGDVTVTTPPSGVWTVGVPELVATTVSWSAVGYGGDDDTITNTEVTGTVIRDVTLFPDDREVLVEVTSAGGDGLAGVTVTATLDADTDVEVISDPTDGDGETTLTLAPGAWTLTTDGAAELDPPHVDESGTPVVVPIGGGTFEVELPLTPFVELSGTVQVVDFAGGPESDPPSGSEVELSHDGATIATAAVAGDGSWSAYVPPDVDIVLTYMAEHYTDDDAPAPASSYDEDTPLGKKILVATPRALLVTVLSDDSGTTEPLAVATVTATYLPDDEEDPAPPDVSGITVDDDDEDDEDDEDLGHGQVVLFLAPGEWEIEASDDGHLEADEDGTDEVTVVLGVDPAPRELTLKKNSVLLGRVVEVRGNDRVAIPGVTVTAERDGEAFSTVSTEPGDDGDNYRLRMRPGTWRITAERGGEVTVADEAFTVVKDGPGTPPNRLEIVVPIASVDLAGEVVDEAGLPVAGATVHATSAVGTVSATSGEDGRYVLADLDNRVTWTVTFTPPDGFDGRPVTRYVALSGQLDVALQLDQVLPSGYGTIEVAVTGGVPSSTVEVALTEATPFPTVAPDGRVVRDVTLDAEGAATVSFEDLVPGDGRSVPQNRFTVTVTAPGHGPLTRSGLDVTPGGTTAIGIDLGLAVAPTREVIVTALADGDPLNDRTLRLVSDGTILTATVQPGTNLYTIAGVAPGEWVVRVDGFEDAPIVVPDGGDAYAVTVHLVAHPDDDPWPDETDGLQGDGEVGEGWDDEWDEAWNDANGDGTSGDGAAEEDDASPEPDGEDAATSPGADDGSGDGESDGDGEQVGAGGQGEPTNGDAGASSGSGSSTDEP